MKKLDGLDKYLQRDLLEGSERGSFVDIGAGDSEVKVAAGAGTFVLGVIKEGFRLNMVSTLEVYEESNNKSFEKDREFDTVTVG